MMAQPGRRSAVLESAGETWAVADVDGRKVGERIKALRAQRRWSAQALANECSRLGAYTLTRSTISKVEADLRRLQADEAVTLARALGVSVEELLGTGAGAPRASRGPDSSIIEQNALAGQVADRAEELDALLSGLNSMRGPHTWLVLGPPGMGKSTLLSQLAREAAKDPAWAMSRVDARDLDTGEREDVEGLLARMLGEEAPVADEPAAHRLVAQRISREGKRLLCLLDSAELLSNSASVRLRAVLSNVYHVVQQTRNPAVWLTFVVASRRDDGWRGVTPVPRLRLLPLPELDVNVVEDQLRSGAGQARAAQFSAERFTSLSALVHRLTAGLPALIDPFLTWIRSEEWLDLNRLEEQEVFQSLAGPYIREQLLTPESLLPGASASQQQCATVKEAVRLLVRYRFFTQWHLRDLLARNTAFKRRLDQSGWRIEDLWEALSAMALSARPLDEPWQEFHPAIRRLLYRYFYPSDAQRAEAHQEASAFLKVWEASQSGKDQVVGLVEGLWHNAAALRLRNSSDIEGALRGSVRELGDELHDSRSYTVQDLRHYAAERIIGDTEFQESLSGNAGLADELIRLLTARA
jgi:transcriptional regulator with XRE-family HTH domain